MQSKEVQLLGVIPVHPGRGEPSRIELNVILSYLRGEPIATIVLTADEAVDLIAQLARSIQGVRAR